MPGRRLHLKRGRASRRSVARDLRYLNLWAERLSRAEFFSDDRYWDFKLPISTATAEEAKRTPRAERRILKALARGVDVLRGRDDLRDIPYIRFSIFVCPEPSHFDSRITLYFDRDYYASKYNVASRLPDSQNPFVQHSLLIPEGFIASGTRFSYRDDWTGMPITEEHWMYGDPV